MRRASGLHQASQTARARAAFVEYRGEGDVPARQVQIVRLPRVEWKGKELFTLRCRGLSGKGPHDVHVPESLLWSLIDFRAFRCPYHANSEIEPV